MLPADLSPEQIAEARALYDAGVPYHAIGTRFGFSESAAARMPRRLGWPPRSRSTPATQSTIATDIGAPDAIAEAETQLGGEAEPDVDSRALARRVEMAVRTELAAIGKSLSHTTAADAERNARTLASLVKSLAELRKLDREDEAARRNSRGMEDEADDRTCPPADLARLREELAQHLERLHAEEGDTRSD